MKVGVRGRGGLSSSPHAYSYSPRYPLRPLVYEEDEEEQHEEEGDEEEVDDEEEYEKECQQFKWGARMCVVTSQRDPRMCNEALRDASDMSLSTSIQKTC